MRNVAHISGHVNEFQGIHTCRKRVTRVEEATL